MAASREDVDRWINYAKDKGIRFIISVCDCFDYEDYPSYCKDFEELVSNYEYYRNANMQKINEIIEIDGDDVTEDLRYPEEVKNK